MSQRSEKRAQFEVQISRAHRSLFWARKRAEELGEEMEVETLDRILAELTYMGERSLHPRRSRRQLPGQTSIPVEGDPDYVPALQYVSDPRASAAPSPQRT